MTSQDSPSLIDRPSRARLALFAAGDFAFNLYWQSVMLYLLFYYTDAVRLQVEVAAATYMVASIWDGIASFIVGTIADRRGSARHYQLALTLGALPLGICFTLLYLVPAKLDFWGIALILGIHMLFRTAYALVNIPYLAMSARISANSDDRAFVAGLRMLAGTAAAVIVALATRPVGAWLMGEGGARAYLGAAILYASIATIILWIVGASFRDGPLPVDPGQSLRASLASAFANRAFMALGMAMIAMIIGVTILNKSVLYYFKYRLGDEKAGQFALAAMMAISAVAVPMWMLVARRIGVLAVWFIANGVCVAGLLYMAVAAPDTVRSMQTLLTVLQAAIVGLNFVVWALIPDAIDYGHRQTNIRAEGTIYGLTALLQRVAIGLATGILGITFERAGFIANIAQRPEALAAMRASITLIPLSFFVIAAVVMLLNPLSLRKE